MPTPTGSIPTMRTGWSSTALSHRSSHSSIRVMGSGTARGYDAVSSPYDENVLALLFLAFVVLPVLEVYVIVQVAGGIGWPEAIALVILVSLAGAVLVKIQGFTIWARFQSQLAAGRMPSNELVDGGLVLIAATLMLTPGFITDFVGLFLLVPPTRALVRRPILRRIRLRAENHQAYRVWTSANGWRSGTGPVVDTDGQPTGRTDPGPYDDGDPAPEIER